MLAVHARSKSCASYLPPDAAAATLTTMVPDLGEMVESAHTIGCSYVCQKAVAAALSRFGLPHK